MPEAPQTIQQLQERTRAGNRKARILTDARHILREWIAQTPGALPEFATDKAPMAVAVAETYYDACLAMVVVEPVVIEE